MLVAVTLTLIMMTTVVTVFGLVMDSISNSRSTIEMTDRLRAARNRLALDLQGATAPTNPPLRPEDSPGGFEIIEGPIGAIYPAAVFATRSDENVGSSGSLSADYTVGDNDDVLWFTARSASNEPFTGRFTPWNYVGDPTNPLTPVQPPPYAVGDPVIVESRVAEVCWFLRGTTLYRRVLLVLPGPVAVQLPPGTPAGVITPQPIPPRPLTDPSGTYPQRSYYALYDISARQENGPWGLQGTAGAGTGRLVANTLGDLTKRENRYGHQPYAWPHDARFWGPLRMPTLRECSSPYWPFPWNDPSGGLSAAMGTAIPSPFETFMGTNRPLIVPNGASSTQLPIGQVLAAATAPSSPSAYPYTAQLTPDASMPVPMNGGTGTAYSNAAFDAWRNPMPFLETQPLSGQSRTGELTHYVSPTNAGNDVRVSEDIILTNVLEFDVKVWDLGAPIVTVTAPGGATTIAVSPNENWETDPTGGGNDMWSSTRAMLNSYQSNGNKLRTVGEGGAIAGYGAFVDLNYFCTNGISTTGTFNLPAGAPYFPPSCVRGVQNLNPASTAASPPGDLSPLASIGLSPLFHHAGDARSGVRGTHPGPLTIDPPSSNTTTAATWPAAVYDTWSTHYEQDGINQRLSWEPGSTYPVDAGTDGIDNDGAAGIDDPAEQEAPPPYSAPLRAIQIKIRVFDPDSRQVREVTLEHEFLPGS